MFVLLKGTLRERFREGWNLLKGTREKSEFFAEEMKGNVLLPFPRHAPLPRTYAAVSTLYKDLRLKDEKEMNETLKRLSSYCDPLKKVT